MNQRDKLIVKYAKDLKEKFNVKADMELLKKVTIACGPSIYNRDSATISSSEPSELEHVKNKFLIQKLKLEPDDDLEGPLNEILSKYGVTNRTKYRVVVYYLLVKHFNKEAIY
ncbi:MAG: DUF2853 family protein [Bacteroidia bacterium]|nr:DUF2853 family protein [Bacteroidia bacterium]NND25936.1 DUF2853 family protein [Flavobacteriaceae bacterium]MBT8278869.1 DUF2853 family protein [Bacteroidia bacterium]NNK60775.1 DUF2853 family protein [Flavobacteriaceae bacterium]NNL33534.1 DUF2853 family protein [Flavobacteriaceae bacterium]